MQPTTHLHTPHRTLGENIKQHSGNRLCNACKGLVGRSTAHRKLLGAGGWGPRSPRGPPRGATGIPVDSPDRGCCRGPYATASRSPVPCVCVCVVWGWSVCVCVWICLICVHKHSPHTATQPEMSCTPHYAPPSPPPPAAGGPSG